MTDTLPRAAEFIWHNARLLDRQRFRCLFQGGERQAVLAALRPYQNAGGGFGNALEPDLRGPDSQPVPAEAALRVLVEIGGDADVAQRLCEETGFHLVRRDVRMTVWHLHHVIRSKWRVIAATVGITSR